MPEPRPRLSRDRVLRAAVAIADERGIEAVSMRQIATALDVVPMALYKHVSDKEDLLAGMIDLVIAEYGAPSTSPPAQWRLAVQARLHEARSALQRHPWAREVIETRRRRTPAVLGHMNGIAGLFLDAGFSPTLTHHAMHALGHRIWGFSPEAFEDPEALPVPEEPEQRARMMALVKATYPHILTIALSAGEPGGRCDEDYEFGFTLDLLLDGFERLRDAGWAPPSPAPAQPHS